MFDQQHLMNVHDRPMEEKMAANHPPQLQQLYTDVKLDVLGFHDCYVFGLHWDAKSYSFLVDLDYVAEWVKPNHEHKTYRFWVVKAELKFKNVDDVKIGLEWKNSQLICQIKDLKRKTSRKTPNGRTQWLWEFELSAPDGELCLWATDIELSIQSEPVLSNTQHIREVG